VDWLYGFCSSLEQKITAKEIMGTAFYWIEVPRPGRLAISSRPRGGDWLEDEVRAWRQSQLNMIVSFLASDEVEKLELTREAELCRMYGLQFLVFPITQQRF
jgi:hypothetical protein